MLVNASSTSNDEPWQGQGVKEESKKDEFVGSVTALKKDLQKIGTTIINIDVFSQQIVAEIFNKVLTVCKANI